MQKKRRLGAFLDRGRAIKRVVGEASSLWNEGEFDLLARRIARRLAIETERASERTARILGPLPPESRGTEAPERLRDIALDTFLTTPAPLRFDTAESPRVSVVAAFHNDAASVLECLRSLHEQHAEVPFELIIIDNGSTDEVPLLLENVSGAVVVRNDDEKAFRRACNEAAESCQGEFLLILDGPVALVPGALGAAVGALTRSPETGAVGGRVLNRDGTVFEAGGIVWSDGTCEPYAAGADSQSHEVLFQRDVDYCSCFLLVRRARFVELGMLGGGYGQRHYLFADICTRFRAAGARVAYDPRCTAFRFGGAAESVTRYVDPIRDRRRFATRHESYVATRLRRDPENVLQARSATRKARRLLFIDDRVPHPSLGMGYPRSWEMLRIVCGLDYDVTFLPASIPEESWPSVYSLVPRDVEVVLGVFRDRIESFLSRRIGYYDVILASREYNMRPLDAVIKRRPQWFAGVRIVYDAEALFCLRQKNFDELMGKPWSTERLESEIAAEVQVTRSADVVLSVTEIDRKEFERFGAKDVRLLIHTTNVEPTVTPFSSRKDILFVGSMHFHPSPNSDSILWFVENVFPEIRARLGDVRLLVVGINKVRAVTALASDAVQMLGVVPDLSSLFEQSRIFIAPTRYSGGVPLKVCEAAAWGLPCVVTDLVASQIGWKNGQGLLSAPVSDATGFAAQCVKLYTDESVWTGVRETALTQISELCSEAAFRATLESALAPGPRSR